jgi:uncharacterized membrane protein YkoI
MRNKKSLLFGVIAVTTLGASLAFAGENNANERQENDATLLSKTTISLTQAITAAEGHVHGKAMRAELEDENGTLVYGVEVASGNQTTDVKVDVNNGKILSAQADKVDHGSEGRKGHERRDEGHERSDD